MTLRDFADAIRPELQAMPAPLPRHALLERIIADRTSGARAILPSVPPPARPKLARYAVAIALAAALLVLVVRPGGRRDRDAQPPGSVEFVSSSAFLGSVAFAEAGPVLPRPALPPAQGTHPERLHPMQLEYSRRMTDSAGKETSNLGLSLALSADSLGDVPAWRVVSAQRVMVGDQLRLELDTVYVARDDPGAHRPRPSLQPILGHSRGPGIPR